MWGCPGSPHCQVRRRGRIPQCSHPPVRPLPPGDTLERPALCWPCLTLRFALSPPPFCSTPLRPQSTEFLSPTTKCHLSCTTWTTSWLWAQLTPTNVMCIVATAFQVFQCLHQTKCEGPATKTIHASLVLLRSWVNRHTCHRQELESLVGHLHHACMVVHHGRAFLRWMITSLRRWASSAYQRYIHASPDILTSVARVLAWAGVGCSHWRMVRGPRIPRSSKLEGSHWRGISRLRRESPQGSRLIIADCMPGPNWTARPGWLTGLPGLGVSPHCQALATPYLVGVMIPLSEVSLQGLRPSKQLWPSNDFIYLRGSYSPQAGGWPNTDVLLICI